MNSVEIFSQIPCRLGEGCLWHSERRSLFWFDILNRTLYEKTLAPGAEEKARPFDKIISAAQILPGNFLAVAAEDGIYRLNLQKDSWELLTTLEANLPKNRSNDGRGHPSGAFWIGTMGKCAEKEAGTIYRYFEEKLSILLKKITIPNAICFTCDGKRGYYTDTPTRKIFTVKLNPKNGCPIEYPQVFSERFKAPDGAFVDKAGNLWCAHWGLSKVIAYSPCGDVIREIEFPATQISCPVFGGENSEYLFVTSAREGLTDEQLKKHPHAGKTFCTLL